MKYLKKFETTSAYNAAQSSLILPNVSLIAETNGVAYNPLQPSPTPSHDYVEIGGVKWATMNVGANSITDTGLYFQWGDTQGYTADQVGDGEGQKYFDWEDYKYAELDPSGSNGSGSGSGSGGGTYKMTKYNETDGKTVLDASDDPVTAAWGGNWRMPTTAECAAFIETTTSAWTADYQGSGVAGLVLTSKADSNVELFFPACGIAQHGEITASSNGFYWLNLCEGYVYHANTLDFSSSIVDWVVSNYSRFEGHLVRGVLDE